eukprot:GEMP01020580.1.p1 GENE.GEMP01020580.1~~GEMP01020580.1.p1  ORF type:complete len:415 (+),score=95.50 GEMP01020580.1:96-1340(+)
MARLRSPSFGNDDVFQRADVVESPSTVRTLRTAATHLTIHSNKTGYGSDDVASAATFGIQDEELDWATSVVTEKTVHSGRTLPSNPRGTPPRQRRKPDHKTTGNASSPSSPSSGPHFGSPISSPARISAKAPPRGSTNMGAAVDSPPRKVAVSKKGNLDAWKFQSTDAVDPNATHGRRRRGDFSPKRTEGAERGKDQRMDRDDRDRKRPTMDAMASSAKASSPAPVQPATHAQPAGYPVELSPRCTPGASEKSVNVEKASSAPAKDSLLSLLPSIAQRPRSPMFGASSPDASEKKTTLLLPPKQQAQSLQRPTQGRNQFVFVKMMEGNTAPAPRPITRAEVALHCKRSDCWMILHNKVYDVTSYLPYHPGGKAVMAQFGGKDATGEFLAAHHWISIDSLISKLYLGPVAPDAKK